MDSLVLEPTSLVFYIVTPPEILNLSSTVLRSVLSAIKRGMKCRVGTQTLFHFVPEHSVVSGLSDPNFLHAGLSQFVNTVYDRVLRPVDRSLSPTVAYDTEARAHVQDHAFILARPLSTSVKFVREPYPRSLDVVDRHTMMHVAYQLSSCGKWLLAVSIDQRGEAHDLKAWPVLDDADEVFTVLNVCGFALSSAKKANVEWRLVIAKAGWMTERELDGKLGIFL